LNIGSGSSSSHHLEPFGGAVVITRRLSAPQPIIPWFFLEGQSFVWNAIQRGTKKVFQRAVQKNVNQALGMIWTATVDWFRQVLVDVVMISNNEEHYRPSPKKQKKKKQNTSMLSPGLSAHRNTREISDDPSSSSILYADEKEEVEADEMDDITVVVATE
jgi:hypothetical protein